MLYNENLKISMVIVHMSETVIIELSQREADHIAPGEYRVQLATPVTINEGDQLSFRMASLDTNQTDTNTILIERDQPVHASFSYYELDYSTTDKANIEKDTQYAGTGTPTAPVPTFDYHCVYSQKQLRMTDLILITILNPVPSKMIYYPEGGSFIIDTVTQWVDYTPNPLVQCTFQFSYLDENSELQFVSLTGTNAQQTALDPPSPQKRYPNLMSPIPQNDGKDNFDFGLTYLNGGFTNNLIYVDGTLQLIGVTGNWSGGRRSPTDSTVSSGSVPPGWTFDNPPPYDTTVPLTLNQFKETIISHPYSNSTLPDLVVKSVAITLPAGRYDPVSLAVKMTQLLSDSGGVKSQSVGAQVYTPVNPLLVRTDDPSNEDFLFRLNNFDQSVLKENITFTDANTYTYYDVALGESVSYAVGTSQFSMEYGQQGEIFSIAYMHMPISNPAEPGQQNIALYYTGTQGTGDLKYFPMRSASGIAFHDLQPRSFWQDQLGLYEKLRIPLMKDLQGISFYDRSTLIQNTTGGFEGLSTFLLPAVAIPNTNPVQYQDPRKMVIPLKDNPTYFDITGQSRAILGETISINQSGGYYLIECLGAFRRLGGYIDKTENRHPICAIVSTQFDSGNCVTAFADSGIPFVHSGLPYLITDVTVRILDPITKKPVTNLGQNNAVWLEINKNLTMPPPQAQHQPNQRSVPNVSQK
jgi:hypothetical protein